MKTAWFLGPSYPARHGLRRLMLARLAALARRLKPTKPKWAGRGMTRRPSGHRRARYVKVLSLVERGGDIRSVTLDHRGVGAHLRFMAHEDSRLVTDKAPALQVPGLCQTRSRRSLQIRVGAWRRAHQHARRVFQRVQARHRRHLSARRSASHFDRYLAEFDFRQNTRAKLGIDDTPPRRHCAPLASRASG